MCYGIGGDESYYYLGSSAMRNLSAAFSANGVAYMDMEDKLFCENDIEFTTVIVGVDNMTLLNWYIDDTLDPTLQNQQTWTRHFRAGNYVIKMEVSYDDGTVLTYEGALSVGAHILIYPAPTDGGDTTPESGCFKVGSTIDLNAIPH
jgi:hypothetical protein